MENADYCLQKNKKKAKTRFLIFLKVCICPCIFKKINCCNDCKLDVHVMGQ